MGSLNTRINRVAKKATVLGATAATAAALTVGAVATEPPARELHSDVQLATTSVYTTGPLFRLLDVLGVELGGLIPPDIAAILAALGISDINNIPGNSVAVNNTLNAQAFTDLRVLGRLISRTRTGIVVGIGQGSFATTRAYQALRSSAAGDTWDGYDALEPGTTNPNVPNRTNLLLVLLRNPSRPNGGLYARFAPIASIFHIDTTTPPAGIAPNAVPALSLNATTVDATWAYDALSDFPVTLNPFAVANSLFATLPTNLLGGVTVEGDDPTSSLVAIGVWLGLAAVGTAPAGSAYYFTANPNDLPLLEPLRLPVRVINGLFGWNLPTPIANALQPAAKILVNIAYTDVVTPADIAADPSLADDYEPYDRTFSPAELSIPTPLYSRWPLTFDEYLRVPGDTLTALLTGIVDEIRDLTNHSPEEATFSINAKGVAPVVAEGAAPRLPKLGAGQREVLADVDASIDEISSKVSAAAAKFRADISSGSGKTLSRILKAGADDKAADVKVERKTPVKDALQKAGKDLKRAVDTVSAKVKKALKPKRSVAAE